MKRERIGIIFGGRSGEHEVSLMSASSVVSAVDRQKYEPVLLGITREGKWLLYDGPEEKIEDGSWQQLAEAALERDPEKYTIAIFGTGGQSLKDRIDFAFPVLHGPYGEDGTVQGLFEMMDIPYAGCGVAASAVCMDKAMAKAIFAQAGLPQVKYRLVRREEWKRSPKQTAKRLISELSLPLFVKPANMGSSVGIGKAGSEQELIQALDKAAEFDRRLVVEQFVPCREIETAVLGNFDAQAAAVGEIIAAAEFYDYEAKYHAQGQTRLCIPAPLDEDQTEQIRAMARKAYEVTDCCGFARVDFFIDRISGEIYLNEINTIPGFTKYSMFPILWKEEGVPYPEVIERIITLGYERHYAKNHR